MSVGLYGTWLMLHMLKVPKHGCHYHYHSIHFSYLFLVFCFLFLRVGFSLFCGCQLVADMMLDLEFP